MSRDPQLPEARDSAKTAVDQPNTGETPAARFDVILYPHRSLSPRGFTVFMAVIVAVSFAAGLAFAVAGAWPVLGFFGLDALAIYVAFRLNYRSARLCETVQLYDDTLILRRIFPNGQSRTWSFQPYWVRISVETYSPTAGAIRIKSHGRQVRFGTFLGADERSNLADALSQSLRPLQAFPV